MDLQDWPGSGRDFMLTKSPCKHGKHGKWPFFAPYLLFVLSENPIFLVIVFVDLTRNQ